MALSLKQVEKRKKSLNKKTPAPQENSRSSQSSSTPSRPWKHEEEKIEVFSANPHFTEEAEASKNSKLSELIDYAQKNSYVLSKLTKKISWWQQIQLYPKIKIPVPSVFHQRDEDSTS